MVRVWMIITMVRVRVMAIMVKKHHIQKREPRSSAISSEQCNSDGDHNVDGVELMDDDDGDKNDDDNDPDCG